MSSMEAKWRWILLTSIAPISWGATYFVTATALPAGYPWWGGALRALPAGLLLLLLVRRRPRGRWWWRSVILGLLNFGAFFVLIYAAAHLLPTSVAASVMALAPLTLAGLAWPLLGERPTIRLLLAATLGIAGVILLVGLATAGVDPLGVAASAAALLLSSLGAILTTRWRDEQPLLATTAWQLTAGGLVLVVFAVLIEGPPPAVGGDGVIAYAGVAVIATALAFFCWFSGLRHLPAGTVGTIGLLNPVTGILCGVLLAGERLTPLQLVGIALIAVAIGLSRARPPRPARVPTGADSGIAPVAVRRVGGADAAVDLLPELAPTAAVDVRPNGTGRSAAPPAGDAGHHARPSEARSRARRTVSAESRREKPAEATEGSPSGGIDVGPEVGLDGGDALRQRPAHLRRIRHALRH